VSIGSVIQTFVVSRVIKKLKEYALYIVSLCFVVVNQLHLFAVNIKEYHWLVDQIITLPPPLLYGQPHYTVNDTMRSVPLPPKTGGRPFPPSHFIHHFL